MNTKEELMAVFDKMNADYPDSVRHVLIADSADGASISELLEAWGIVATCGMEQLELSFPMLRCIAEAIYVMGVQRGRRESDRKDVLDAIERGCNV